MTLQTQQQRGHALIDQSFQTITDRVRDAIKARGAGKLTSYDVVQLMEQVRAILEVEEVLLAGKLAQLASETEWHGYNQ